MNNLYLIGWLILTLYILQETDAIPQWGKLLRLKFLKYVEYENQNSIMNLKYTHFLLSKYPNFFVYLFTCQECLSVWLTIIAYFLWNNILSGWKTFGLTMLGVLLGMAAFKAILRRLYD